MPPSAWWRKRDRELEAGSSAHYDDAAYYAKTYADRTDDVRFYVALAKRARGPVLEIGAGNGRITLAMARAGVRVVAVDLSAPMLADLRARLAREPPRVRARVRVVRADMRRLRLDERFGLVICPFNTILHLYERRDFERFFARVREHLAPRGRFVFDASLPAPADLARDPARLYRAPALKHPTTGETVRYAERFDYDHLRQVLFVTIEMTPTHDASRAFVTPLSHRQLFPQELLALLHYNGLAVTSVEGDFEGEAPSATSDSLVFTCRAMTAAAAPREAKRAATARRQKR